MSLLVDKYRVNPRENALVLFLREAAELHDAADECHSRLLRLTVELERCLAETGVPPENTGQHTQLTHPRDDAQASSRSPSEPQSTSQADGTGLATPKDFFISYNSADQNWAEWIAWQLEVAGYSTVLQAWDFRPGSNFVLEMHKASQQAERTIAVLSPAYLQALYTQPEWAAAFAQDPTGALKTFLPVRVKKVDLSGLLAPIVYIDLVSTDADVAKERLLTGIKHGRAKPATAPGFPGD